MINDREAGDQMPTYQTDRERERERESGIQRERERVGDRGRDRESERERWKETEREREKYGGLEREQDSVQRRNQIWCSWSWRNGAAHSHSHAPGRKPGTDVIRLLTDSI